MAEGPGEEVVSCERCNERSRSVRKRNFLTMCVVMQTDTSDLPSSYVPGIAAQVEFGTNRNRIQYGQLYVYIQTSPAENRK
jgi:hypothetical protein